MRLRRRLNRRLRRVYFAWRFAPLAHATATGELFSRRWPDVSHLALVPEVEAAGPLQRDEALLLYGAVRASRAKTIVEVGFLAGHSAFNFLRAMDDNARLYSFDIDPGCGDLAAELVAHDDRFRFTVRSQEQISSEDIDGRQIDLLFIDASHDLALNQRTFSALEPLLAPRALVAIHDTGAWSPEAIRAPDSGPGPAWWVEVGGGRWVAEGYAHQPSERDFVNWIHATRPQFAQIHFHATSTLRHGLTLLQTGGRLSD